jgi:uncharacterized LabA/DUF88 family protein
MAVLIDADNVPRNCISDIMQELAVYGTPTIKRIYGDWTNVAMSSWKAELLKNAFTPMQQYGYTTGKNSTDSAMIIDAMDILYAGAVEAFCIVSSDSDFTRLALRLREAGKKVYGVGENKTPEPFRVACDKFIYVEVLNAQRDEQTRKPRQKPAAPPAQQPPQPPAAAPPPLPSQILVLISNTIEDVCDDDGWAYLGEVGSLLQKKKPDFDPRSYGYKKLTLLVGANDNFEMDARENTQRSSGKQIYVRNRR